MKYYGFLYKGRNRSYNHDNCTAFNDKYAALKEANNLWDSDPDLQIARLLVVLRVEDCSEEITGSNYAFFQFTNSQSCREFVKNESKIVWSESIVASQ